MEEPCLLSGRYFVISSGTGRQMRSTFFWGAEIRFAESFLSHFFKTFPRAILSCYSLVPFPRAFPSCLSPRAYPAGGWGPKIDTNGASIGPNGASIAA